MISLLLAAEGLGALGCSLGAARSNKQDSNKHDSYICIH